MCFSTIPGEDPAIFSISSKDFVSVDIIPQDNNYVEYIDFMRENDLAFLNSPVAGEGWISTGWDTYHSWEDGRYEVPCQKTNSKNKFDFQK